MKIKAKSKSVHPLWNLSSLKASVLFKDTQSEKEVAVLVFLSASLSQRVILLISVILFFWSVSLKFAI